MKLAKGTLRALVALVTTLALVATAVYYKVDEMGFGASEEQTTLTIAYLPITMRCRCSRRLSSWNSRTATFTLSW